MIPRSPLLLLLLLDGYCYWYRPVDALAIIPFHRYNNVHRPNIAVSIRQNDCSSQHQSFGMFRITALRRMTSNDARYDDDSEIYSDGGDEYVEVGVAHPSLLDDWFMDNDEPDNNVTISEPNNVTSFAIVSSSLDNFIAAPITLDQLSEAFATNVSYFYLKDELQLSDTAMWRITYEASSVLGMTTTTIRRKVNLLRETMNLTADHIRTILERQPTILHLSADQNLAPTLLFLLRALELGRDELRDLVVSCPAVLCYSINNLKSKVHFFTGLMKYSIQECRELVLLKPDLLRASVTTGLIPHYQFLRSDIELSILQLQKVVQKNPNILLYSLEENLIPKLVYYMIMNLQMNTKQIHKLVLSYPQILDYNLDHTIIPMTEFFTTEIGFSAIEFRNILLKFPRLMTHALRKVKRCVGYFRYELNMVPIQVKKVIYRAPAILGLNLEVNIRPKVQFVQSSLHLTDEELHTVISAMPSILLLNSAGNIQPKIDFLSSALSSCGADTTSSNSHNSNKYYPSITSSSTITDQLRDIVLRLPTLLGYSLEQRIVPRIQAIMNAKLHPSCITIGIPMTQPAFDKWLQRRAIKYHTEKAATMKGATTSNTPAILLLPAAKEVSLTRSTQSNKIESRTDTPRIVHWVRERRPLTNFR